MSTTGAVEWYLDYGSDFQLTPSGDILLALDNPNSVTATTQRLERMLLTNPRIKNLSGQYITAGDDLFHPDFGAGLPATVGQMARPQLVTQLQATVLAGLQSDGTVASSPAPTVTVTFQNTSIFINVICTAINGQALNLNVSFSQ